MAINEIRAGETMHVQGEEAFGRKLHEMARWPPHAAMGWHPPLFG